MKASVLINTALNLSGILSNVLQEQDSQEGQDGLFWLNRLLKMKSASGKLLPYYGHVSITPQPNQEIYFVENLVTAEVLTFFIQGVRYSMRGQNRNRYFGEPRAENISSLPFEWYWERVNGGMNIYIYFKPDPQINELKVTGLLGFDTVTYSTEFNDFMDDFYQTFLMYELAQALCNFYKISLPPDTKVKLKEMQYEMNAINPRDFYIKKKSLIGGSALMSYGQVNIGKGGVP